MVHPDASPARTDQYPATPEHGSSDTAEMRRLEPLPRLGDPVLPAIGGALALALGIATWVRGNRVIPG